MWKFFVKLLRGETTMDEEEYVDEGWEAYYDGWEYEECPYPDGRFPAIMWKKGWVQAENNCRQSMTYGNLS